MQNYCKTIGALAAASALVAGNASAEVEYELHTGYTSAYLFRGVDLGQDLIEAGVDVAGEWNGLGLSAGAWYGSFESPTGAGGSLNNANADELDLYAEVSKDLGYFTGSIGYIYYYNQQGSANRNLLPIDDAQEVYFSAAQSYFGVDFALTYFWDIETDNDGYAELSAGKGFEISPCLTLNTGATLAYLFEEGDFAHLTAKVALDWAFTETATLSPFVAHSWGLGTTASQGYSNELVAGSLLSVSF
ncbi:hypothetical protein ACFSSA_01505 [Luteolibacter algae]|uniref:Porin n=1 Tax=Luteolibacter algae TaxID=454151 RepID=A0ABW5D4M4_9BACT